MSELRDRLEALANRGTQRGVDDVLGAAQRDAQAIPSENGVADFDSTELPIIDDDLPVVTLESRARKGRRYGSLIASFGIAALVGVGALAVAAMFGSGGAGSPEGAVRQLADAVSNKDPLAAVDVLVPSEVRSMRETVKGVTKRAAELKIVDDASKPLAGVDLSVDHLALRTESLADGYAKVVITSGDIDGATHKAQLSALLQKAMARQTDGHGKVDLSKLAGDSGLPTFLVVIKQDGGWFVSPAYTALEYIRELNGYPAADFGSGKTSDLGAATPDAAVQDALHAWQASNWDRMLALAPPDELPIYDYRAMIDAAAKDTKVDFTIDHLTTTSTVSGDTGVVKLDASGTSGSDHRSTWKVGGTCPSLFDQSSNSDNSSHLCLSGDVGGTLPFGLFYAGGANGDQSSGPISISVVRENGRWFVSPVTTVLDVVDAAVKNIDKRTIYTLFGLAYELPPDATITLDQPFDVPAPTGSLLNRVYAFDGKAGQEVVGEIGGPAPTTADGSYSDYVYGTIYTADGKQYGSVDFQHVPEPGKPNGGSAYVSSVRLPVTGSYRLVLEPYAGGTGTAAHSITLWDVADAPAALRAASHPSELSNGSDCGAGGGLLFGGTVECKFSTATAPIATTVTPTTFTSGSSSSSSSSSSGSGASKSVTATSIAYPPESTPIASSAP